MCLCVRTGTKVFILPLSVKNKGRACTFTIKGHYLYALIFGILFTNYNEDIIVEIAQGGV